MSFLFTPTYYSWFFLRFSPPGCRWFNLQAACSLLIKPQGERKYKYLLVLSGTIAISQLVLFCFMIFICRIIGSSFVRFVICIDTAKKMDSFYSWRYRCSRLLPLANINLNAHVTAKSVASITTLIFQLKNMAPFSFWYLIAFILNVDISCVFFGLDMKCP